MKLTLERAKRLLEGAALRQTALILCDTPEEAEDVLRAACCWLTHLELQATPQSIDELEKAYLEAQTRLAYQAAVDQTFGKTKDVIFPVDEDDNLS